MGKNAGEFCFKKIIKFYLAQNKPLRKSITNLTKHIEALEEESEEESSIEEKPKEKIAQQKAEKVALYPNLILNL